MLFHRGVCNGKVLGPLFLSRCINVVDGKLGGDTRHAGRREKCLEICEVVETKVMECDDGWTLWISSPGNKDGSIGGGKDLLSGRTGCWQGSSQQRSTGRYACLHTAVAQAGILRSNAWQAKTCDNLVEGAQFGCAVSIALDNGGDAVGLAVSG